MAMFGEQTTYIVAKGVVNVNGLLETKLIYSLHKLTLVLVLSYKRHFIYKRQNSECTHEPATAGRINPRKID